MLVPQVASLFPSHIWWGRAKERFVTSLVIKRVNSSERSSCSHQACFYEQEKDPFKNSCEMIRLSNNLTNLRRKWSETCYCETQQYFLYLK